MVRKFLIVCLIIGTLAVWTSMGFVNAIWFVILFGVLLFIGYAIHDIFVSATNWANQPKEIIVRHVYENEDVVEGEVVEDKYKRRWWEV